MNDGHGSTSFLLHHVGQLNLSMTHQDLASDLSLGSVTSKTA